MPVSTNTSKLRAKSFGNGGQELKPRPQEELGIEMMALRKELSLAKDEVIVMKGRIKRMEEEHSKKLKQLEKHLAAAKKESSESEKKREASAESVLLLKQKCQKLEQSVKEQEVAMRKLQASSRPTRPTELKGLVVAYSNNHNTSNSATTAESKLASRTSTGSTRTSGPSPATTNELLRLKDSVRKLQVENSKLQQQVKEKNGEIKQLKQQASRAQGSRHSMSGSNSAPSALAQPNARRSNFGSTHGSAVTTEEKTSVTNQSAATRNQQRLSRTSMHRASTLRQSTSNSATTTTTTTSSNISKSAQKIVATSNKTQVSVGKKQITQNSKPSKPLNGSALPIGNGPKKVQSSPVTSKNKEPKVCDSLSPSTPKSNGISPVVEVVPSITVLNGQSPEVTKLQQNIAAKKIQRSWRDHQQKVLQSQGEGVTQNSLETCETAKVEEITDDNEQEVELLQSVLRGHQERLQFVAMQPTEDEDINNTAALKQALGTVQAAHQQMWNQSVPQEE